VGAKAAAAQPITEQLYGTAQDAFVDAAPPTISFAERYFVGAMERGVAEKLLHDAGSRFGDFVVRESKGAHVLSVVKDAHTCTHHKINADVSVAGQFTINQKHSVAAGSLSDLIKGWLADPVRAEELLHCTIAEHAFVGSSAAVRAAGT